MNDSKSDSEDSLIDLDLSDSDESKNSEDNQEDISDIVVKSEEVDLSTDLNASFFSFSRKRIKAAF